MSKKDSNINSVIDTVKKEMTKKCQKRKILQELDLVVLDNSIRESTVGQLRGHTLANKWKIYDEVERCGFQFKIVALCSLDVRGKPLSEANHWAESSSIGQRSSFRTNQSPNSLVVENLNLKVTDSNQIRNYSCFIRNNFLRN